MIDEELLSSIEEQEDRHNAVAKLIELGRKKNFVTYDDILLFFPEAEQDGILLLLLLPLVLQLLLEIPFYS